MNFKPNLISSMIWVMLFGLLAFGTASIWKEEGHSIKIVCTFFIFLILLLLGLRTLFFSRITVSPSDLQVLLIKQSKTKWNKLLYKVSMSRFNRPTITIGNHFPIGTILGLDIHTFACFLEKICHRYKNGHNLKFEMLLNETRAEIRALEDSPLSKNSFTQPVSQPYTSFFLINLSLIDINLLIRGFTGGLMVTMLGMTLFLAAFMALTSRVLMIDRSRRLVFSRKSCLGCHWGSLRLELRDLRKIEVTSHFGGAKMLDKYQLNLVDGNCKYNFSSMTFINDSYVERTAYLRASSLAKKLNLEFRSYYSDPGFLSFGNIFDIILATIFRYGISIYLLIILVREMLI